jgi:hypothetical protein
LFTEPGLPLGVETSRVASGRANTQRERLPPFVEAWMLDVDCENALLDLVQPGCLEQLRKVAFASTSKA